MKDPVSMTLEMMATVTDRAIEDTIDDTGMLAPIELYQDGPDKFDMVTANAEEAGTQLFRELFAPQRAEIAQMIRDTKRDAHAIALGNADLASDIDDVDDDDIDELLMLALDPRHANVPDVTPSVPPTIPEIEKEVS